MDEEPELELDPPLADPGAVRAGKAEARRREADREEMVRAVVGLPQGRKWLREVIFTWCHVNAPSINEIPALMGFAEGERNIGQRLLADVLAASPKDFLKMLEGEE